MNMAISISKNVQNGEIIPFKSRKNVADKFEQGYVQSSQLYRREVYPFLTDAARAVYFELENHINGYHKESDHVSYSQLQGSKLEGARKLSRQTIAKGIAELLKEGVITLVAECRRRGNKYRINEVSLVKKQVNLTYNLVNIFYSKLCLVVPLVNHTSSASEPPVVPLVDTQKINFKDSFKDNKKKDWFDFKKLEKHVLQKNEILGTSISVKQLTDATWYKYEFEQFEEYNANNQITDELKHSYLATWLFKAHAKYEKPSFSENKGSKPKQQTPSEAQKKPVNSEKPSKPNGRVIQPMVSLDQMRLFARKLSQHEPFASKHAQAGESDKDFKTRLIALLGNPSFVEKHIEYLKAVGYGQNA